MKKIKTVFVIDRKTNMCTNEVQPGSEWVLNGEGVATVKFDGTACLVRDGKLFKRMDRKLKKPFANMFRNDKSIVLTHDMFKDAPCGWEACEEHPDIKTGHWPGWVPVDKNNPADKWHIEAFQGFEIDGTYELIGPMVQSNKYAMEKHKLIMHSFLHVNVERSFDGIKEWLKDHYQEGIVFHHEDGRMAKIRRKDFGLIW